MRRFAGVVFLLFLVFSFAGCVTFKEAWHGFAGVSIKALEESRPQAIAGEFDLKYEECFDKAIKALSDIEAYVYKKDRQKGLIAIYISQTDTTAVGLFLEKLSEDKTKVEVSSPSTFGKEIISARVFALLKGLKDPVVKRAQE